MQVAIDVGAEYDRYFGSGLYAERYPRPNDSIIEFLISLINKPGSTVLDFGCGNGRYSAALLDQTDARVFGYDISRVAIQETSARCADHLATGRLTLILGDLATLRDTVGTIDKFDLVIMMFGVLGHIPSRTLRQETLTSVRPLLRPGGKLVVTVPNALRRFAKEQRQARPLIEQQTIEAGDILYHRTSAKGDIDLYYHLYSPGELVEELESAEFRVQALRCESFLPETAVVHSPLMARLDRLLSALLPVSLAYGLLAVAEPADQAAGAVEKPLSAGKVN